MAATDPTTAVARATAVVDLGLRACDAYGRQDLAGRLQAARRRLADPAVHVVVVGEFKKGKSSLINALVGAEVCPVADGVATALPTFVRHGDVDGAHLLFDGDPPRREPIALAEVRDRVLERDILGSLRATAVTQDGPAPSGLEVRVPCELLAGGLVLVDTPGVGGLGSAHAAASLAAASMADAVVFVTDASQELTRSELDVLRQASQLCETVVCVLAKTDFYPSWRTIHELDVDHLGAVDGIGVLPVSSMLRARALAADDAVLDAESGFPALERFLVEQVSRHAGGRLADDAATEALAVCAHLEAQFEAERAALADPARAEEVVDELRRAQERVDMLRSAAARWNQTLTDGLADLGADVDHDLRRRVREVVQEADDAIDQADPADTWPEMAAWLETRVAHELLANYRLLRERAIALSEQVGHHFEAAFDEALARVAVPDPARLVAPARSDHEVELNRMNVGLQAMVALKNAYGGTIIFLMLGSLVGVTLAPLAVGIGLVMGRRGLRDEKRKQRAARQQQARNAIRRYCDEISFVAAKDSRDALRRIQRQLRDHYTALADELDRSNAEALERATDAVTRNRTERAQRLKDVEAELDRIRRLREHARDVLASGAGEGAAETRSPS